MKTNRNLSFLIFILILFHLTALAQTQSDLYDDYKLASNKLDSLYRAFNVNLNLVNKNDLVESKLKILMQKKLLKNQNAYEAYLVQNLDSQMLGNDFELLDGYIYDWSNNYYRIVCRIRSITKKYSDFVKLTFKFYKNNILVKSDYAYIDYETYGYSGMLPYHTSVLETFIDKVDFDRNTVEISFTTSDGSGYIFWDQILKLESCQVIKSTYYNQWKGSVRNTSSYSVKFPKIIGCIFRSGKMIDFDYAYLDVTDYLLPANTLGTFDSYIDLPASYDEIKYALSYSLYSLTGSGNITSNWPSFTKLSYIDTANTTATFELFLIDHENDYIKVKMDWGDNSALVWSNNYLSGSVAKINHIYSKAGNYLIKAKSSDKTSSESSWTETVKITILPSTTSVYNNGTQVPKHFCLYQNHPNPFNTSTKLSFDLPRDCEIQLAVYNLLGEKVALLTSGNWNAGHHEIIFNALNLPSSLYFYKLETNELSDIKKMTVLK